MSRRQRGRSARRALSFHEGPVPLEDAPNALDAAEALLRNPAPVGATPEAHDRWWQDVTRFVAAGQVGQELSRHSRPLPLGSKRPTEHSWAPPAPTRGRKRAQDMQLPPPRQRDKGHPHDLRDSINTRRVGEDARLAIERTRERHRLELASRAPPQLQHGAHVPPVPFRPGCRALTLELRAVEWP